MYLAVIASLNTCTPVNEISSSSLIRLLLTQLPCAKSRRYLWKEVTLLVLEPQAPFLEVALVAAIHLIAQVHKHLESEPHINVNVSNVA